MPKRKTQRASSADLKAFGDKPMDELAAHHQAARDFANPNFSNLPEAETFDIRFALSQIMHGQQEISRELRAEMAQVRERMDKYDKAAAEWDQNQAGFQQNVLDRAEKLKASGETKERIKAQGVAQLEKETVKARAKAVVDRQQIERKVARMKKVTITAAGHTELSSVQGQPRALLVPDVVLIKHMKWVLPPGVPIEVPYIVAERYEQMRLNREELELRKSVLAGGLREDRDVARRLTEIGKKYGSPSEAFPIV